MRLGDNRQFIEVLGEKKCVRNDIFILYLAQNSLDYPRFGISVGKKFGNAVNRNRLKRIARELCRLSQHDFPQGHDYILIYSSKMTNNSISSKLDFETARDSLKSLIEYAKRKYKIQ